MLNYIASLPTEDRLTIELSKLYEQFGYKKYCMAKFEEYSFYSDNRNFLSDDGVIAFNNSDGRLLALKPDITLSIVKNAKISEDSLSKLYYNESVYRIAKNTRDYKEIKQSGVELLGEIDSYSVAETVYLAAKSLEKIDSNYVLSLSHMAIISTAVDSMDIPVKAKKEIMKCLKNKNYHDIETICRENNVSKGEYDKVIEVLSISGKISDALEMLKGHCADGVMKESFDELESIYDCLSACGMADRVYIDFSVMNHIDYYNGIIFQGYVEKSPAMVLAGGRYDKLAGKIRKNIQAIGFAVYLDNLNLYYPMRQKADSDVIILSENANSSQVLSAVNDFIVHGKSVRVERKIPQERKNMIVYRISGGKLEEVR